MARVACDRLHGDGADLFGRGNRPGLLELVGDGTLLLTNIHQVLPVTLWLGSQLQF